MIRAGQDPRPARNALTMLKNLANRLGARPADRSPAVPTELRKIVFSTKETIEALRMFCKSAGQDFPHGDSFEIAVIRGEQIKVELKNAGGVLRTFNSREVVVSLMQLCRHLSIPVPKRASKSIDVHDKRPALLLRLN